MACRVLPPRSAHPLAAILLPDNGLLVGGKNYQGAKTKGRQGCRKREIKRWREREWDGEICLRLCLRIELQLLWFVVSQVYFSLFFLIFVSPHSRSPSGLWVFFIFLMSCWFFSLPFFFVTSFVLDGRQYLSCWHASVCIQRVCVCVCGLQRG